MKKEQEVLESVKNLARLHKIMKMPGEEVREFAGNDLREEFLRHNRELRKVRAFIRGRTAKGDFENAVLKHFDAMYEWAEMCIRDRCRRSESSGRISDGITGRCSGKSG